MVFQHQNVVKSETGLDFASTGVACFALTMLQKLGIISKISNAGKFDFGALRRSKKTKDLVAVEMALKTLVWNHIFEVEENVYTLTEYGKGVVSYTGLISMVFGGYGKLLANSTELVNGRDESLNSLMDGEQIAISSIQFGEKAVDPVLISTLKDLKISGTFCDLGCGSAHHLIKVHREVGLAGLGLDSSEEAVNVAERLTKIYDGISIELADVAKLEGIWEDVSVSFQCFMTHDIGDVDKCIGMLNSYLEHFPNMQYLIVVDIAAPDEGSTVHMPAYDYLHALMGVKTRSHTEWMELFSNTNYHIRKEICLDLPNSYMWVLSQI